MAYILDVDDTYTIDDVITKFEEHTHLPYTSQTFNNNDEIRIPIHQQDVCTLPSSSYLYLEGTVTAKKGSEDVAVQLVNNAIAYLFDEIRYEINGAVVDRTKNVGMTTTIKNLLSRRTNEKNEMEIAGWSTEANNITVSEGKFAYCVPLRTLLGFAEDYRKVMLPMRQELVLMRASTDNNAVYIPTAGATFALKLEKIQWRVPYVTAASLNHLKLMERMEVDRPTLIPFRTWQLHEYPVLLESTEQKWTVKTAPQSEKPRFVALAFQTARKNKQDADNAKFDLCGLYNIKLYLNAEVYPYDNLLGNKTVLYKMFTNFQNSYYEYDEPSNSTPISYSTFIASTPIVFIDCSKQKESLKAGPIDVRMEFESKTNFPANTSAYCLLISDTVMQYTPLTNLVTKIM